MYFAHSTGSPNCPTVHTTVTTTSLTVTIQKALMRWLPEWYCVKAISYNGSIAVYNSTLKDTATVNVTSLQPGTVYNISVIPCNMAGCNGACDVYSIQTEFDTGMEGEIDRMCTNSIILHYYVCKTCIACYCINIWNTKHYI